MRTYDTRSYEAAYLAGLVAGSMTRSGLPGVAGALPTPAVLLGIMRSRWAPGRRTRPCARGRNNEWFNPPRGRRRPEPDRPGGGEQVLAPGQIGDDAFMRRMNFCVMGVEWRVPS